MKDILPTRAARRTGAPDMPAWMKWNLVLIAGLLSSNCATDYHHIYTAGSFRAIPGEETSVLVWADDPTVHRTVQTWLRNHGLIVVDMTSPRQEMESCQGCERKTVLSQARLLKADQVVFAQLSRSENPDRLEIFIQSLSVKTEEDLWNGTARRNLPVDVVGEQLETNVARLSCHALATVWRYRPAGYLSKTSTSKDYCYFRS